MTNLLKLDFNERSDKDSPLAKDYSFRQPLWQYPERQSLEKQIAELNQLEPGQVLCTNGGDEAIYILMRIIKESTSLILPLPAFSQYTWGVKSWQLDANLIEANPDLTIDLAKTQLAIQETSAAVTIITRPNNPTGESIPIDSLENLIKTSKQNNGWIFLDEAYVEFNDEIEFCEESQNNNKKNKVNSLLAQFNNLVILRTFSKAYGLAGIRLGYLLGSIKLIKQFGKKCLPFNISQPNLTIASQALSSDNRIEVKEYCQQIVSNRKYIVKWLTNIGISVQPSQANFVLLKLPKGQAQAIRSFLARKNILVRTFEDENLTDCLRVTIPFEIGRLINLLQQVLQPKLVCLDMDGVLIDTSGSYDATIKATVKQLSGQDIKQQDIYKLKDSGGFNNDWIVSQQLLVNLGIDLNLEKVTEAFQKLYLGENNDGLVANETPLANPAFISTINRKEQTQFAVVTGRPANEAKAGLGFLGLDKLDLISLDDVKQPKPSPEGIQRLQAKYSSLCWMCGDNPDDIFAAIASNSLAIGIGRRNAETLYKAGADIVLDNINELEAWLCPLK